MNCESIIADSVGYDAERHSQVFACDTRGFAPGDNWLTSSNSRYVALYPDQIAAVVSTSCSVSRVSRITASNPRYDALRRSVRTGQHHMRGKTVLQQGERHRKTKTTTVIANGGSRLSIRSAAISKNKAIAMQGRLPRRHECFRDSSQ